MGDKSWKAFERFIASRLGTQRIPVPGRKGPDVRAGDWEIDAKLRKEVPKSYRKWLDSAHDLGYNAIAIEVDEGTVICTDFKTFVGGEPVNKIFLRRKFPATPIEWLRHMESRNAAVVMRRPRERNSDAVVLFYEREQ